MQHCLTTLFGTGQRWQLLHTSLALFTSAGTTASLGLVVYGLTRRLTWWRLRRSVQRAVNRRSPGSNEVWVARLTPWRASLLTFSAALCCCWSGAGGTSTASDASGAGAGA